MGDILEIKKDEVFSADLLLLYAENESNESTDLVFVDTMNLDGETNLKPKKVVDARINNLSKLAELSGQVTFDKPSEDLVNWQGTYESEKEIKAGSLDNLLLRGCTLKNTKRAFGVVMYVGKQAKIMKLSLIHI